MTAPHHIPTSNHLPLITQFIASLTLLLRNLMLGYMAGLWREEMEGGNDVIAL